MTKILIHHCKRCQHEWTSKLVRTRQCPKCHAVYWWLPARRRYDVSGLAVGESLVLEWPVNLHGELDNIKTISMNSAVRNYGKRSDRKFYTMGTARGLLVRRTR